MADYTFADLKNDLTGLVGGTDLAKITNLNALIERAGRRVLTRIEPPTTKRKALITLYDQVYDYSLPSDDDFKRIFDLRPQVLRNLTDDFSARFSERFDLRKEIDSSILSTEWRDGTQYIRIKKSIQSKNVVLDNLDVTTNWSAVGDATNITSDTLNKAEGSASINFDLSGAGTTGGIENSSINETDLSEHDEQSSLFMWVFFPDSTAITSVDLRWGNSSTVYWSRTVTAPHFGSSFVNGWNLLRFDWNGATETGTVDPAAIDYLRANITYNGTADTDFRFDQITSRLGEVWELWYYSKFMFRTSGGQWQATISSDTDIVNLDIGARNILVYECEDEIGKQLRDDDMRDEAREELFGVGSKVGLYEKYRADFPSEAMKKRGVYYRVRNSRRDSGWKIS